MPDGSSFAKELSRLRVGVRPIKADAAVSPDGTCFVAWA